MGARSRKRPWILAGAALALAFAALGASAPASADPLPGTCAIVADPQFPAAVAAAPDGRVFYNELYTGRVRVISKVGGLPVVEPVPFVEIIDVNGTFEQGLLGLTLDPDWNQTPWLYVYYTAKGPPADENRIVRYWAAGETAGVSELVLGGIKSNATHNGGIMKFGPDGKLYVSVGDALEPDLAQSNASLNGKILRLEKNGSIPADNPDPGSPVFTLGHRSVFGLDFNPWTGAAYITENGPDGHDEINILQPGRNYGWPLALGIANDSRFVDPILDITVVTAPTGLVFDTSRFPTGDRLDLYYGNFNTGLVQRLVLEGPSYNNVSDRQVAIDMRANVLALERIPAGPILITTVWTIYTFDPQRPSYLSPIPELRVSRDFAYPGIPIAFDASASHDPDGDGILSTFMVFGDGSGSAQPLELHAYPTPGTFQVSLKVIDGCTYESTLTRPYLVRNASEDIPPRAQFETMAASNYAPAFVRFDARRSFDPEGGPVLRWQWRFGDGVADEGPVVWHQFVAEGSYDVWLTVYDELNVTGSAMRTFVVLSRNVPPVALMTSPPFSGSVGTLSSFDGAASSDPDGSVVEALWQFGDGESAPGLRASHYYREPGNYRVTLTVVDGEGAANSTSINVQIAPAPRASPAPEAFALSGMAVVALLILAARPRRGGGGVS